MRVENMMGPALNWAAAVAKGLNPSVIRTYDAARVAVTVERHGYAHTFAPSTDWAEGGPLLSEGVLSVFPDPKDGWRSRSFGDAEFSTGPTPLVALVRRYVIDRLGPDVDVPPALM